MRVSHHIQRLQSGVVGMTYHDEHDPELHPDDVPHERDWKQPFIAAAFVLFIGACLYQGAWLAMSLVRWATS